MTYIQMDDANYDDSALRDNGISGKAYFLANGMAVIKLADQSTGFYWKTEDDRIIVNGENNDKISIEISGNKLQISNNKQSMLFRKVSEGTLPVPIPAYSENTFWGKWRFKRAYSQTESIMVDAELFPILTNQSVSIEVEIEQDNAGIKMSVGDSNLQWKTETSFHEGTLIMEKPSDLDTGIKLLNSGELQICMKDMYFLLERAEKNDVNTTVRSTVQSSYNETLSDGTYRIGEDIPEGTYTITCIEADDYLGSYMNTLGGLASALDKENKDAYETYFNMLGGLAGEPTITVRVIDMAGYTVKSAELKEGETVTLQLKAGASLSIADGKCSLVLK